MAEGLKFVCGGCGHEIEAWSDGNTYYSDGAPVFLLDKKKLSLSEFRAEMNVGKNSAVKPAGDFRK